MSSRLHCQGLSTFACLRRSLVCAGRNSPSCDQPAPRLRGKAVAQLKITLIRSGIGSPRRQKEVLVGLGLTRLRKMVVREDRPEIRGMLRKIQHLIHVD